MGFRVTAIMGFPKIRGPFEGVMYWLYKHNGEEHGNYSLGFRV